MYVYCIFIYWSFYLDARYASYPTSSNFAAFAFIDAIRAVKLITGAMATAIIEGRQGAEEEVVEEAEEVQE